MIPHEISWLLSGHFGADPFLGYCCVKSQLSYLEFACLVFPFFVFASVLEWHVENIFGVKK